MSDAYEIRRYEPQDRRSFIDLYESVHGERKSNAWLDWKYVENPFAETVSIIVAEHRGSIIGARPLFALPMRRGRTDVVARQPADAMVDAAHRRRGVFTRMIESTVESCANGDVDFLFTFPNARSGGAYRKLGWDVVGELTERFRLHRASPIIAARSDLPAAGAIGPIVSGTIDAAMRSKRLGHVRNADVVTEVHPEVPIDELNTLYRDHIPDALHAPRTRAFLEWRFNNPDWTYRTFLGYHHGSLTAAIVTGTREMANGGQLTRCIDVLPLDGGWQRSVTLEVLLADVIQALDDVALFVLPDGHLSREACGRRGFLSDRTHPIDLVADPTLLFVHPLSPQAHQISIGDRDAWRPTFVEYDTA